MRCLSNGTLHCMWSVFYSDAFQQVTFWLPVESHEALSLQNIKPVHDNVTGVKRSYLVVKRVVRGAHQELPLPPILGNHWQFTTFFLQDDWTPQKKFLYRSLGMSSSTNPRIDFILSRLCAWGCQKEQMLMYTGWSSRPLLSGYSWSPLGLRDTQLVGLQQDTIGGTTVYTKIHSLYRAVIFPERQQVWICRMCCQGIHISLQPVMDRKEEGIIRSIADLLANCPPLFEPVSPRVRILKRARQSFRCP